MDEFDDEADGAHDDEADSDCLADLDEFALVGCVRLVEGLAGMQLRKRRYLGICSCRKGGDLVHKEVLPVLWEIKITECLRQRNMMIGEGRAKSIWVWRSQGRMGVRS